MKPAELESRTQGSRPRPRPRTAFPRTDTLETKDRNARGQGQGPRTQSASALKKKKKKKGLHKNFSGDLQKKKKKKKRVFTKIFQAISTKKRFPKNFSTAPQNFNFPKNSAVLEPRTGQFSRTSGLEAKAKDLTFEAKDFKICPRGRPRGQGLPRGLHLWKPGLAFFFRAVFTPGFSWFRYADCKTSLCKRFYSKTSIT